MRKEITSLTGLRGIAACWVVLYHSFAAGLKPNPGPFANLIVHGYLAVDIFFVLSGFVMAMSYGAMFSAGFNMTSFRVFLLRRLARIYPLYLVLTCFALAVLILIDHTHFHPVELARSLAENLALVDAWGLGGSIDGPAWSISTELAAYLLFPWLAAVLLFRSRLVAITSAMACLMVVVALSHAPTPASEIGHRSGPYDIFGSHSLYPVIRCVVEFSLGLVVFRAAENKTIRAAFQRRWLAWFSTAVMLALLLITNSDALFVCLVAPFVLILAVGEGAIPWALGTAPAMFLGRISYAVYLLHLPLLSLRHFLLPHLARFFSPDIAQLLAFAIFAAVLGVAASLAFRFIEQPGRSFIRNLELRVTPSAPGLVTRSKIAGLEVVEANGARNNEQPIFPT